MGCSIWYLAECAGVVALWGVWTSGFRLSFDGELDVVAPPGERPDPLAALLDGLLVSRLETPTPSILASPSRRFRQTAQVFQPPDTRAAAAALPDSACRRAEVCGTSLAAIGAVVLGGPVDVSPP